MNIKNKYSDTSDFRCIKCSGNKIETNQQIEFTDIDIVPDAMRCMQCGATFGTIYGVPFFGDFEEGDILGLIEIAAKADRAIQSSRKSFEEMDAILSAYHGAPDKKKFIDSNPNEQVRKSWFQHRYRQWLVFALLSADINLNNLKVLDVAAGFGADAFRLVKAGANVTAIDFNPIETRNGIKNLPEARWVGGFSHFLPFKNACFDIVCCNAGLHHLRDVSFSIEEMIRVTKPNGKIITTGDPYRPDFVGIKHELEVFDSHHAVLGGINEGILPLASLLKPFEERSSDIELSILTLRVSPSRYVPDKYMENEQDCFDNWGESKSDIRPLTDINWWKIPRDRKFLGASYGNVSLLATLNQPKVHPAPIQTKGILSSIDYASVLNSDREAIQRLSQLLIPEYVDIPFPFKDHTKFNLLNGWRSFEPENDYRPAYRRARWFLTYNKEQKSLSFEVRLHDTNSRKDATVAIFINSKHVSSKIVMKDEWIVFEVPLQSVQPKKVFCCEIHIWPDGQSTEVPFQISLDSQYSFIVRNRRLISLSSSCKEII